MNVPRILVLALAAFFSGSVHAQADLAAEPGVSAPCERDFQKIYTAWLNRTIIAHYLADKGPKGARYMTAAVNFIGSNWPGATPPELLREEIFRSGRCKAAGIALHDRLGRAAYGKEAECIR